MPRPAALAILRQRIDHHFGYDLGDIELAPEDLPSLRRERRLEGLGS